MRGSGAVGRGSCDTLTHTHTHTHQTPWRSQQLQGLHQRRLPRKRTRLRLRPHRWVGGMGWGGEGGFTLMLIEVATAVTANKLAPPHPPYSTLFFHRPLQAQREPPEGHRRRLHDCLRDCRATGCVQQEGSTDMVERWAAGPAPSSCARVTPCVKTRTPTAPPTYPPPSKRSLHLLLLQHHRRELRTKGQRVPR